VSGPLSPLQVRERPGGVVISVRVQPKASRDELTGIRDGALWVKVSAPPVAGKANAAVVDLLATKLGIPRGSVALTGGARSHTKTIQISGIAPGDLEIAVEAALTQGKKESK
jgi:uncharacterized protein